MDKKLYNKMDLWQLKLALKMKEKTEEYEECAYIRDLIILIDGNKNRRKVEVVK